MSVFVTFCDRNGDSVFLTELVEAVPRIGERVTFEVEDRILTALVTLVSHDIRQQQRNHRRIGSGVDVRVYVLLDVDRNGKA